ncbi:MAG: hypothetical protein COV44_06280 [Deltaproteobacteria bacterium CG11_big_fil_rev_8_21_14_0_20_45_16]|nr:MAG: hypothetical protein COV44_06280 [Deltaproteobacteria bacterium CG11_big_fil_rev_8_21_14_0_20_45_16]
MDRALIWKTLKLEATKYSGLRLPKVQSAVRPQSLVFVLQAHEASKYAELVKSLKTALSEQLNFNVLEDCKCEDTSTAELPEADVRLVFGDRGIERRSADILEAPSLHDLSTNRLRKKELWERLKALASVN